jgi:(2Fe-2S) ferredoxin
VCMDGCVLCSHLNGSTYFSSVWYSGVYISYIGPVNMNVTYPKIGDL